LFRRLMESGITDDDLRLREAPLDVLRTDPTGVPEKAWLVDGQLYYQLKPIPGTGRLTKERSPRGMLDSFIRIRNDASVLRFAERYGVLGICQHFWPNPHYDTNGRLCGPQEAEIEPKKRAYWEPTHRWRELAVQGRALAEIAAKLYGSKGANATEWGLAFQRAGTDEWAEVAARQTPEDQRVWLAMEVNRWLAWGRPELRLIWPAAKTEPTIEIVATTWGTLALQLLTTVARYRVVAFCDICGEDYYPDKYRPRVGQRRICGKEECRLKADALRKREERERRRRNE
jgi:hypothetical protein